MTKSVKRYLTATLLACSLAANGSAVAAEKISPALQLRQDVTEFVTCLLKHERPLMATYVVERGGNLLKTLRSSCFSYTGGGRLTRAGTTVSGDLLVGVASELMLRDIDLDAIDPLLPAAPAIDHGAPMTVDRISAESKMTPSEKEAWVVKVNHRRSLNMLGECMVRKDPVLSRRVFLSDYGSDEESAALAAIVPVRAQCSSIDVKILDPRNLRLYLASNYARLAGLADPSFKEKLL